MKADNDIDFEELLGEEEEEVEISKLILDEEAISRKYSDGQLRIVRSNMDFPLNNLKQVIGDKSYLNLSPTYQRRNRWDLTKRSQLIESFLMNIPIPPIFLFEKDYNSYEVMDGRQRLQTVIDYLDNKFALNYLEYWTELNGKKFRDLPSVLQKGLYRRTISAIVLLAESSRPDESEVDVRMVLFKRLNTGGIQLNPQELRNALYPSLFNQMIMRVSRSAIFTKVWQIPAKTEDEELTPPLELLRNSLYKSMADCELVLRFFAIKETIEMDLKGSLRRLLDDCMIHHLKSGKEEVNDLEDLYLQTLEALDELFDGKPFVLQNLNRPSYPLYDALMVAYYLLDQKERILDKDMVQARLEKALSDEKTYDILTGKGNTIGAVKDRISVATHILVGNPS